jgi:8-oxo-dGTP pyrophosphatase MutT (NUDIX family)
MSSDPNNRPQPRGGPSERPSAAQGAGEDRAKGRRKQARRSRPREISAGGVVIRGEQVAVIVPTRRAGDGSRVLALPKGHLDPGESTLQAATREVREETGILAEAVCELGESRYWYRRDGRSVGKTVTFYLFTYISGDTADHDDEVLEVRWIDLREALTELSYEGERSMIELALAQLDAQPHKDR